jgi:predicted MPP superfamily phosphohydrolase
VPVHIDSPWSRNAATDTITAKRVTEVAPIVRSEHKEPIRRAIEKLLDVVFVGGWLARLCYPLGLQGSLSLVRYRIGVRTPLPRPLTVAFASDFHAGPTTDAKLFDDLFGALELIAPDLLLLGGDFVSGHARHVLTLARRLERCRPPLGKFGVLGNHDLWADDAFICRALEEAGVTMLVNGNAALAAPYEMISVCGIDDPWSGAPDGKRAFREAAPLRIFLTHSPDGLLAAGAELFDVGFAGHTHAGQIARRDGSPIILPDGPLCKVYPYGRFLLENGASFVVSRGVGCSTLPFRVHADPELIVCEIHHEA